jgi:hypothetical protein|tara:strand:+ start:1384 stop:1653 length:270 start_codon:yes stop_codon:yes gene_type:complete
MTNKDMFEEAFPDDKQVGGSHYKDNFNIQPWTFIRKNGLNPFQANVIKYVCRYLFKGKTIEDINKIIHYCELEKQHLQTVSYDKKWKRK